MAKCRKCGKKGLFFKVNAEGICNECERIEIQELEDTRLMRLWQATHPKQDQEKAKETPKFDILNKDTWNHASEDKSFIWKGEFTFFANDGDSERDMTEKEMVQVVSNVIQTTEGSLSDRGISSPYLGSKDSITLMMECFSSGKGATDAANAVIFEIIRRGGNILDTTNNHTDEPSFEILDMTTWDHASASKEILWNGNKLLNIDGRPHTEKEVVELARAIFNFLEKQDGCAFPSDKKIVAVTNMLNKMENPAYYAQLEEERKEEFDNSIPDGLFDPRNPETYNFAKHNKRLVIDGITIFDTHTDINGKEVKKYETEKDFVDVLLPCMKTNGRARKWERAINLVKDEFAKQGIEKPNDHTLGYVDRINEVYQSLLLDDTAEDVEEAEKFDQEYGKKYLEKYIKQKVAVCTPKKRTRIGGYGFSEAQLDVLDGIPLEKIIKIGKIMSAGRNKGSSMLKQEIFNSLAIDGHWVVALRNADTDPEFEEGIMHDFYLGYEFSTEEEARDFFDSRSYLDMRSQLKEKVIENAIEYLST